jgi:Spy/CpxP family protein refolding chaperone
MKTFLVTIALVMGALTTSAATAQGSSSDVTDMQTLRSAVKTDKRAFVAATLALTDAQAKKFWPIYDAYQRRLDAANRMRAVAIEGLLSRDKPITDLYAKQLAADLVASDEAEVKARRTLYGGLMRALPATTAARYLQLESKVRAIQNYDLAVAFPLIR